MKLHWGKKGYSEEDDGKEPKEMECEKEIRTEREQYDFVSTIFMRYLREKYGRRIANRALWRSQKRKKHAHGTHAHGTHAHDETPLEKILEQFKDEKL